MLRDITNPSRTLNIDGKPLTQLELQRVAQEGRLYVDQFLREVSRRLLGSGPGSYELQEIVDPSTPEQAAAWVQAGRYLDGRIQADAEHMPGRTPDLSPGAASAMRAVMAEVGSTAQAWAALRHVLFTNGHAFTAADGVAGAH